MKSDSAQYFTLGERDRTLGQGDVLPNKSEEIKNGSGMLLFTLNWGLHRFKLGFFPGSWPHCKCVCCFTRVEQNDSFEADELLGFELQHAEARRGGEQHVEYLGHSLDTVALIPGENGIGFRRIPILWGFFYFDFNGVFFTKNTQLIPKRN